MFTIKPEKNVFRVLKRRLCSFELESSNVEKKVRMHPKYKKNKYIFVLLECIYAVLTGRLRTKELDEFTGAKYK